MFASFELCTLTTKKNTIDQQHAQQHFYANGIVICLRFDSTKIEKLLAFFCIAWRYVAVFFCLLFHSHTLCRKISNLISFVCFSVIVAIHLITFWWWVHGCARNHDTSQQTSTKLLRTVKIYEHGFR